MSFTEEWFGENSCKAVASFVTQVRPLEGRIVEIGCWQGRSTIAIAESAYPEWVDAVDTWNGSPGELSAELAAGRDVYGEFLANVDGLNVKPHRMDWRDYAAQDRSPVKFLHIDAEHTYREVHDTITAFRPLMVPGGIMCGDDAHHIPVMQAVHELLQPVEIEATEWWVRIP